MKIKLLSIASATITALSPSAIYLPESSAKSLATCKVTSDNTDFR